MKISLVIKNAEGKNVVFVSDKNNVLSLVEAVNATRKGQIDSAYVVNKKTGPYLRTKPSVPKIEEFGSLAISGQDLVSYAQGEHAHSTPALTRYIKLYLDGLKEGQPFITPVGQPKILAAVAQEKIADNRSIIFSAAGKFKLDPCIMAAIIIDETARLAPFEALTDRVAGEICGSNTSIGIAQVKIDTANDLIKKGLYNPDPSDSKLPFERMNRQARRHFYKYLIDPKHCIFFEAAYIRAVIDYWIARNLDFSDTLEVIGTLYSRGYERSKDDLEPSKRGKQIATEFYLLAKKWLNEK